MWVRFLHAAPSFIKNTMAKIPYVFYRARKMVERGIVVVDVDDMTDYDAIFEKLNDRNFSQCIVEDQEIHFEDWKFEPQGSHLLPPNLKAINAPEDS